MAEPGRDRQPRRRSRRGRGEESDGCTVPVKPRTKPTTNRWRRWWREGGRPEGRRAATHAPDSVPDTACNRSCEPADWGCMGRQSPEPRSRSTFGRSPVRESRTPGSARGGRGNPVPYRYRIKKRGRGAGADPPAAFYFRVVRVEDGRSAQRRFDPRLGS